MLQLGWKAASEQFPPTELTNYAIDAEKAGFDLIDVSDHFHPWSEAGQSSFIWTWLGAVAVQTNRIHMGPGVTCPILRYHPEALNEYAATGMWPSYKERQERLVEAIELIRALWRGEEVTFEGKYYQTRKAKLFTPPASKIPLYISTVAPSSAAFAGKYGDGLFTLGGKQPDLYRQLLKNFEDGAREAGKDPSQMPRLIELMVEYTRDTEAAIEARRKYWAGGFVYNQKIYTPKMSQENGEVVGPDTIKKSACISANPEDHVKFIQQYIDLGFNYLIFHSAGPNHRAFIEGYGRDILPRLRSGVGTASRV